MTEAVVIGATNREGLTKPYAFVLVAGADGRDATLPEALSAWAAERLEPYKVPREITVRAELPRTHLGKVDRGALRREVESAGLPQAP